MATKKTTEKKVKDLPNKPDASYLLWPNEKQIRNAMVLGAASGLDGAILISFFEGKPIRIFPSIEFNADTENAEDEWASTNRTLLSDNLSNKHSLIIVSERMKNFLMKLKLSSIECHPVTIKDLKKKKHTYFMIHLLKPIDCLDREASRAVALPSNKSHIMAVKKVALRSDVVIDPERALFRIATYSHARLIRAELAAAIAKEFPGMKFRSLDPQDEWNS